VAEYIQFLLVDKNLKLFAVAKGKSRARNISEAESPSRGGQAGVKMAQRVGGGTRCAIFENQSVFFCKESTDVTVD
jgi:hypothetical protein